MYLYIGGQTTVPFSQIVGIFDLDTATASRHTRGFLERAQRDGAVSGVLNELPRSFILCGDRERRTVYLSQISSQTLMKRSEDPLPLEDIVNIP